MNVGRIESIERIEVDMSIRLRVVYLEEIFVIIIEDMVPILF